MGTTWMVEDEHGTAITDGLQEHEARAAAQRIANARGKTVYLWAPDAEKAEEVEPKR